MGAQVATVVAGHGFQHPPRLVDRRRYAHGHGPGGSSFSPVGDGDVHSTGNGEKIVIVAGDHLQRGEIRGAGVSLRLNGAVEQVGSNVVVEAVDGAGGRAGDGVAAGAAAGGGASPGAGEGQGHRHHFHIGAAGLNPEGQGIGIAAGGPLAHQAAAAYEGLGAGADGVDGDAGPHTDGRGGAVGAAVGAGDGRIDGKAETAGQGQGVEVLVCGHREAADGACLHIAHQGAGAIAVGDQVIGVDGNGTRDRQRQALRRFHAKAEGTGAILGPLSAAGDRQLRRGSA